MCNDSVLVSNDISLKALPEKEKWALLDNWLKEQYKTRESIKRIEICNVIRLLKIESNLKSLTLGERYPHLRQVINTAVPDPKFEGFPACHRLKCIVCNQEFWAKSTKRNTCSYRCSVDLGIIRRREKREKARNKICLFCKQPFTARSKKALFCCLKHRVSFFRQQKRKEVS